MTSLEDLNWDTYSYILTYLSLKDLFNLRCVNPYFKSTIEEYLRTIKEIRFTNKHQGNVSECFDVLAEHCTLVRELTLSHCDWLEDKSLITMLRNNSKLKYVYLNNLNNISSVGLQPLIVNCRELEVAKFSHCYFMTTGCLEAFVLHQNGIEEMDLSYCTTLSERSLLIMLQKFKLLKRLSMAHVLGVGDRIVGAIAKYSTQLKHLNLTGCSEITDVGIRALVNKSIQLESLMISGCNRVTDTELAILRERKVHIDRPKRSQMQMIPYPAIFLQV